MSFIISFRAHVGVKIDLIAFKSIKDFENAGKMFKDGLTKGITLFQLVILIHLESLNVSKKSCHGHLKIA